jgi:Zn-dependent peptidase ImmA (M78 family)
MHAVPARQASVPDFAYIRRITQNLLEANGVLEAPVKAYGIAAAGGVRVLRADFQDGHHDIAGIIESDGKTIVVNSQKTHAQRNYTVAYGLGWHILDYNICDGVKKYRELYLDFAGQKSSNEDQGARFFAMHLLVPDQMLGKYLKDYSFASDEQLASVFGVPVEIIKIRRQYYCVNNY